MINRHPLSRPALVVAGAVLTSFLIWLALPHLATAQISPPATTLQPPAAPTNLGIEASELVWDDNSDDEDGFRIYMSVGDAPPEVVATLPADTTSVPLDTLPPVVRIDECDSAVYGVVAFNEAGESMPPVSLAIVTLHCGGLGEGVSPPPLGGGPAAGSAVSAWLLVVAGAGLALVAMGGGAYRWASRSNCDATGQH